jgi:hypothetical protein
MKSSPVSSPTRELHQVLSNRRINRRCLLFMPCRSNNFSFSLHTTSMLTSPSNILFLPFRKTTSLALSAAIKQYISSKYDQHPDMFKQDLEVIDALRRDAVNVREPHNSGIKKIAAYAGQLSWMGGKFPIDVSFQLPNRPSVSDKMVDWSRLHMVPGSGLQYRTPDIREQPQIRTSKHPLQPCSPLFPAGYVLES